MTMKTIFTFLVFSLIGFGVTAQETMQQAMEKRAREMHRVICLPDKEQWKKFITENYTQALIDKPMKSQVSRSDDSGTMAEKKEAPSNLDGKVNMFQRLHDDFGDSKITSIKPNGDKLEMVLNNGDMSGTFNLKFTATKPYLIDGVGIQVEAGNR
jgi:hypothetical protein